MANTFKFGNGEWAVGKETALAYNDENSNFKPLPFTFDRASTATVVNKQGLIETVGIDEPRIDFLNNTKGHLLLEPERRNIVTDSEALTYFSSQKDSTTLSVSITNPKGESGAIKYIPDNVTGGNRRISKNLTGLSGLHTQSVFAKKDELRYLFLRLRNAPTRMAVFDLQDGVISDFNINVPKIENYGNGWYRCSATFDPSSSDTAGQLVFSFSADNTGSLTGEFDGDGTSGLFLWGAQIEAGSYATSYIPTQGEILGVTRSAEDAENTSTEVLSLSNQASFYWYLKGQVGASDVNNTGYVMRYNLDTSADNVSYVAFNTNPTDWRIRVQSGSASNFNSTTVSKLEDVKIVVTVNTSTYSIYANGALIVSQPYNGDAITFENIRIQFDINNENRGTINIADTRAYNTELTQAEAIALTTL